jgi:hypothetical protein
VLCSIIYCASFIPDKDAKTGQVSILTSVYLKLVGTKIEIKFLMRLDDAKFQTTLVNTYHFGLLHSRRTNMCLIFLQHKKLTNIY